MIEIKRHIESELDTWADRHNRRPLLVRGARQVGKSFAVRSWGNRHFGPRHYLEINLEEQPQFKTIFEQDLVVDRILDEISLITGFSFARKEPKLLFLDEIQSCPPAIMALRYFYEKRPDVYIIAAGSLIEFALEHISFPVGRVESLQMYPLSFFEFLDALGKTQRREYLESLPFMEVVHPQIHEELLLDVKKFYRVGGMPEVVAAFSQHADYAEVSRLHSLLLQAYEDDFAKYSKRSDWEALRVVFRRAPHFTAGANIKYVSFDNAMRTEKIKRAIELLSTARIVNRVYSSAARIPPIATLSNSKFFKLLFLDIGLMQHLLGFDWRTVKPDDSLVSICDGRFAEQFVGQELLTKVMLHDNLHYWQRTKKSSSSAKIDFLTSHDGFISPIEVKKWHSWNTQKPR